MLCPKDLVPISESHYQYHCVKPVFKTVTSLNKTLNVRKVLLVVCVCVCNFLCVVCSLIFLGCLFHISNIVQSFCWRHFYRDCSTCTHSFFNFKINKIFWVEKNCHHTLINRWTNYLKTWDTTYMDKDYTVKEHCHRK